MKVACVLAAMAMGGGAVAQQLGPEEKLVRFDSMRTLHITSLGRVVEDRVQYFNPTDGCDVLKSHTDANFGGGAFILQQGFAEGESLAASYVLPASEFPLKIDLCEWIVGCSNTSTVTTTKWAVSIYDGTPTNGTLVATYASDGDILPHIVLPQGTAGVNVNFSIDPGDPEQIVITNSSGTNTVTLAWRIVEHHNGPANPCGTISTTSNAFPTTDTSGLAQPNHNWLDAINCPLGCPAGWKTFQQMISLCKPSGDWVTRLTYTSLNCQPGVGACCLPTGCEIMLQADCLAAGGTYKGDGSTCQTAGCPTPTVPCCFQATGGCLNLSLTDCMNAGGIAGPVGVSCTGYVCFPKGACCLPDGTCQDNLSPEQCTQLGGTFQGDGTACATTNCPLPKGACCFSNGFCLELTEADCLAAGAAWMGLNTSCVDLNGNGKADDCEVPCKPDCELDGDLDVFDFLCFQGKYSVQDPYADFEEDGDWDIFDFLAFQNAYATGCP